MQSAFRVCEARLALARLNSGPSEQTTLDAWKNSNGTFIGTLVFAIFTLLSPLMFTTRTLWFIQALTYATRCSYHAALSV